MFYTYININTNKFIMDNTLIKSVLGFNLKADILDKDDNPILIGARSTIPDSISEFKHRSIDKKWFTNYNQSLLDKISDYRKYNQ